MDDSSERPEVFERDGVLYARIPGVGLCKMGSWGWQPVVESAVRRG